MKRRDLLKGTLAMGAAGLAVPTALRAAPIPAQPMSLNLRDRKLFAVAHEQLQKHGHRMWLTDIVGIADYGVRSSEPRFHFCNFETGSVQSFHVSHGSGSDPEHDGWLDWFSDVPESNCSSKGAFMTFGWYTGRYGTSIRLEGLDSTNANALSRAIVMHRASYAEPGFLARWGRLGRSNGCFAMGDANFKLALLHLAGGRLLYSDKLGIGPDGQHVEKPVEPPPEPVTPQTPQQAPQQGSQSQMDLRPLMPEGDPKAQLNPGVY